MKLKNAFKATASAGVISLATTMPCFAGSDAINPTTDTRITPRHQMDLVTHGRDDRTSVPTTDRKSNGIGELTFPRGKCTASLIAPDLIITAAHCVEKIPVHSFTFHAIDTDPTGKTTKFTSTASNVWSHPYYKDTSDGYIRKGSISHDVAIIQLSQDAPSIFNTYTLSQDSLGETFNVNAYGYSADKIGLSVHKNCTAHYEVRLQYSFSECDFGSGGSGGPLIDRKTGTIMAINSAVDEKNQTTHHAPLFAGIFSTVPFDIGTLPRLDVYTATSPVKIYTSTTSNGNTLDTIPAGTCIIIDQVIGDGWAQIRIDPSEPYDMIYIYNESKEDSNVKYEGKATGKQIMQACPQFRR